MGLDLTRVRRMIAKELRQIFRDPRMGRIVFIAPVIQLVIFGYAVNTDIRDTPVYLVDQERTAESRLLVDALTASGYFRVKARSQDPEAMATALHRGEVIVGVQIPTGFTADLRAGRGAQVQILTDGSNSNTATVAQGNALRIIRGYTTRLLREASGSLSAGVDLRIRAWFNPDLASRVYNVPGVLGVIVLLMSGLLTAVAVVRERELGTLEQLLVTPMRPAELILGKTLPVALIASIQIILVTAVAILWFGVPFRGSFLALALAAVIYIVSGLSFGLLISTVARTLQEALMVLFLFFMPGILLSGFMFPVFTMPEVFQWITYANPIRHFLEIVRPVFLKGAGVGDLWPQYIYLVVIAALGFAGARARIGRTGLVG